MRRWHLVAVGLVTALALVGPAGPASAAPIAGAAALQTQISKIMAGQPGGVRTAINQISWYGGRVILTLPAAGSTGVHPATSGTGACPEGYWCFYQNINFNTGLFNDGRMIALTGCDGIPGNLTDYGFNDQTSSWYNRSSYSPVWVYRDINGGGGILWTMSAYTPVSDVGSANNDKASSVNCN